MSDPYRISEMPDESSPTAAPTSIRSGALRPLLWLLLVTSVAANVVASAAGSNMFIGAGFGLAALACATALIVHHYRHRRR
ncbi:hypothetical protein I0C86_35815 [Plantactinospora sp. S1510]|uniref:Uncharacterized protein n=1 Tax=Plantactinospora alkalitolerans TaxID=2789879 RepID=A0ABS0H705_9ACTN|nr:hypothetical protein [Plantactinospora alkalitolerans]MBF9134261.1 hypothetical protein [Plantactinospora alkalitolerans]